MTAPAGELFSGPRRVHKYSLFLLHALSILLFDCTDCTERMRRTSQCMRLLKNIRMTLDTHSRRTFLEQRHFSSRVWAVAGQAHAAGYRGMYVLFREGALVMAGVAEIRSLSKQELPAVRAVRVVATRAHAARNRRMDCFIFEFGLVMAGVAEAGHV